MKLVNSRINPIALLHHPNGINLFVRESFEFVFASLNAAKVFQKLRPRSVAEASFDQVHEGESPLILDARSRQANHPPSNNARIFAC
jgi:hypothetical protein